MTFKRGSDVDGSDHQVFQGIFRVGIPLWKAYYTDESGKEYLPLLDEMKKIVPLDYYGWEYRRFFTQNKWVERSEEAKKRLSMLGIRTVFIAKHYRNFSRFFVNIPFDYHDKNISIYYCFYVEKYLDSYRIAAVYQLVSEKTWLLPLVILIQGLVFGTIHQRQTMHRC